MGTTLVPGGSILMTNTQRVTVNAPHQLCAQPSLLAGRLKIARKQSSHGSCLPPNFIKSNLKLVNYSPNAKTAAKKYFFVCVQFFKFHVSEFQRPCSLPSPRPYHQHLPCRPHPAPGSAPPCVALGQCRTPGFKFLSSQSSS